MCLMCRSTRLRQGTPKGIPDTQCPGWGMTAGNTVHMQPKQQLQARLKALGKRTELQQPLLISFPNYNHDAPPQAPPGDPEGGAQAGARLQVTHCTVQPKQNVQIRLRMLRMYTQLQQHAMPCVSPNGAGQLGEAEWAWSWDGSQSHAYHSPYKPCPPHGGSSHHNFSMMFEE